MSATSNGPRDVSATGWRTNSVASRNVQTVRRNGREYLQFPLVPLMEMVLEYPERGTKEYLPAKHIRETAGLWDGTLLTYVHPKNRTGTVRDPDSFMGEVIGAFHNPRALNGGEKLSGTGLIDVEKAKDLGGSAAELVELLRNGEEVSVSAGYTTTEDEHRPGKFDGEEYDLIQGTVLPDHIAIFPSDSQMQARCSPEDGCAAPRANATQLADEQYANQRATSGTNGVRANMSETESDGLTTEEQRQMTNELSSMLSEVESSGVPTDAQAEELQRLRQRVEELGRALKADSADVGRELHSVVEESKSVIADVLNDSETNNEKANASSCDCARVCTCEQPFTSGSDRAGESLPRANMAAVPGQLNRDVGREQTRENADAYPAGGRKAWERRQLGLDGDSDGDDLPPAGGRSDWERRKQNARVDAEQSGAETHLSAGARRSLLARQNGVDASKVANAEYPLTALRKAKERAEKRERQAELKEIAKRNDVPLRERRNGS